MQNSSTATNIEMDSLSSLPERPQQKTREEEAIMSQFFDDPRGDPRADARGDRYDPRSDPRSDPRADPRGDSRGDPRADPRADPRSDPRSDPRTDPRTDPRYDPRLDPRQMQGYPPASSQQVEYVNADEPPPKGCNTWKLVGLATILFAVLANSYAGGMLSKLPKLNESSMLTFTVQVSLFALILAIAAYFLTR